MALRLPRYVIDFVYILWPLQRIALPQLAIRAMRYFRRLLAMLQRAIFLAAGRAELGGVGCTTKGSKTAAAAPPSKEKMGGVLAGEGPDGILSTDAPCLLQHDSASGGDGLWCPDPAALFFQFGCTFSDQS